MTNMRFSAVMGITFAVTSIVAIFGCSPQTFQNNDVLRYLSNASKLLGCRGCKPPNSEDIAGELNDSFDVADENNDGLLSLAEAQTVFIALTEEEFEALDINGDGFLSREELNVTTNPDDAVEGEEHVEGEPSKSEIQAENEVEVIPGEMVYVAAGTFKMGDPWGEGSGGETPVHDVTLSAYEIGKYEVTNQEYADILNWGNRQGYVSNTTVTAYEMPPLVISNTIVVAYEVPLLVIGNELSVCQITWTGSQFVVDTQEGYSRAYHPVVEVSWYGAAVYCNWLSEKQGLSPCYNTTTWECNFSNNGYHLPTEAQWERAAAWDGSKHYRYGNGSDDISCSTANYYNGTNHCDPLGFKVYHCPPYTSPVGYYPSAASPVGCYDMTGNVREWCNGWCSRDYRTSSVTDPTGPPSGLHLGSYRMLRGGSWCHFSSDCRSSRRNCPANPGDTNCNIGFRVARTL